MKVAVIGSRDLTVENLRDYLPMSVTEIVSGGARGIDTCARQYALSAKIKLTEFRPDYERYGRAAPLKRNDQIVDYAGFVLMLSSQSHSGRRLFKDGHARAATKSIGEVVKYHRIISLTGQELVDVGTDVPGSTRYQNHHTYSAPFPPSTAPAVFASIFMSIQRLCYIIDGKLDKADSINNSLLRDARRLAPEIRKTYYADALRNMGVLYYVRGQHYLARNMLNTFSYSPPQFRRR